MSKKDENPAMNDALKGFLKKHRLQEGLDQVRAAEAWAEVMGPGVASYTRRVRLEGGTLLVSLTSSVLREELSMGTTQIVKMMNEALGDGRVEKIRLQ